MKVIVVGAGGTARELLRRLGDRWDVVLVDPDEAKLEVAGHIRPCTLVVGDGSSSVTLGRAGLDTADAVVAASGDVDVNGVTTRFARDAGVLRVVTVVSSPERAAEFRELGAETVTPDTIAARVFEQECLAYPEAIRLFAAGRLEILGPRVRIRPVQ